MGHKLIAGERKQKPLAKAEYILIDNILIAKSSNLDLKTNLTTKLSNAFV